MDIYEKSIDAIEKAFSAKSNEQLEKEYLEIQSGIGPTISEFLKSDLSISFDKLDYHYPSLMADTRTRVTLKCNANDCDATFYQASNEPNCYDLAA